MEKMFTGIYLKIYRFGLTADTLAGHAKVTADSQYFYGNCFCSLTDSLTVLHSSPGFLRHVLMLHKPRFIKAYPRTW
jgi:hypothetical protein